SCTTSWWLSLPVDTSQMSPPGVVQVATESISCSGSGAVTKDSRTGTASAPNTLGIGRDEGSAAATGAGGAGVLAQAASRQRARGASLSGFIGRLSTGKGHGCILKMGSDHICVFNAYVL